MPRSFLFTSFLLFSHWTKGGHAAPASRMATRVIAVNDLRQRCNVGLDDLNYDLCPLMGRTVTTEDPSYTASANGDRGEGSSSGRRFYDITLGGSTGEQTVSRLYIGVLLVSYRTCVPAGVGVRSGHMGLLAR